MTYHINIAAIDENGVETEKGSRDFEGFVLLGKLDDTCCSATIQNLSLRTLANTLKAYDATRQAALIVAADLELESILGKLAKTTEGDESNGTDEACDPQRQ